MSIKILQEHNQELMDIVSLELIDNGPGKTESLGFVTNHPDSCTVWINMQDSLVRIIYSDETGSCTVVQPITNYILKLFINSRGYENG